MLHTMTITQEIISTKIFREIIENMKALENAKVYKNKKCGYVTHVLKDQGFTMINLKKITVNKKYKYDYMQISITLNPVKLIQKKGVELIDINDIEEVMKVFNEKIKLIHESLPRLENWILNRIDYAINIKTEYVKEYIKLFQRGDKPKRFKELYCSRSKKRKQLDGSLYLFNSSVNINFYDKHNERIKKNLNEYKNYNIIRLEVQCKKLKLYNIKDKNKFESLQVGEYLKKDISYMILSYYYSIVIGKGDYYKLKEAIEKIKNSDYSKSTKEKLIKTLKLVNRHKSIWKAREKCEYSTISFNRYLQLIRDVNINPVTIPNRWDVDRLKNIYN